MRRVGWYILLAWPLLGVVATPTYGCDDPAAANAVRASIASACPCTASTNHGQYVSCVNRQIRQAVAGGQLPTNCKGAVTRCAARSTCGKKSGFVTCCFASPGTCTNGLCQHSTTACTTAAQCPVVTRCHVSSTAHRCTAAGGSPGSGSCCDAMCSVPTSPSGAFLN